MDQAVRMVRDHLTNASEFCVDAGMSSQVPFNCFRILKNGPSGNWGGGGYMLPMACSFSHWFFTWHGIAATPLPDGFRAGVWAC